MKKSNSEHDFITLLGRFFTEYLPISVNASPNTIASYKCAFRLLFQYLDEKTEIKIGHITFEVLDFDLLTKYFDWLITTRKNSRATAKQRLAALASFADYSESRNLEAAYIFKNSLKKISKKTFRKVKSKPRNSFTREELAVLFSLPDTTEKLGWRDLVLLSVMYSSGARAQEICNLTVKDVTHDEKGNAILTLVGKGEKSRRVKITSDATQLLDKYIASRKISVKPDAHIFPSQRNEHLSVATIEEIYEKYTQKAKAEHPDLFCRGPYTPHVMRHTTATHLIESGVPLAIVKNILGHTSIQTTQIYLDISQQTVDRSMEKWNEKWFSKHNTDESTLPQEKNGIPDFLK
jgi:integrase/recombinase XerD